MQISSNNSSTANSAKEFGSEINDQLNSTLISSTSNEVREISKISFSVTKQKTTKVVSQNKLLGKRDRDEDEEEDDQSRKRGILHLENGVPIESGVPRKKEKVFVIPVLRLSNQAQIDRLRKLVEEGTASEQDLARLALLSESVGDNSDEIQIQPFEGKHTLLPASNSGMPTIVLPDDSDPDYESMPVGEFGLAFLRGCGWKNENSAIGRTNAQAVPMHLSKPRPKGLGLGAAVPSTALEINASGNDKFSKNGTSDEKNVSRTLCKNSFVRCLAGMNKNIYGQVTSLDVENNSVFVEIAWPPDRMGKTIRVSQFSVELVSANDFKQKLNDSNGIKTENGVKKTRNR
uniref:Spp2/MOS2 G-patch domain-containing protein n=2 Tax=Meloidogyne incognita group TaxID=654580 RepID=A0A914MHT9_MELIC